MKKSLLTIMSILTLMSCQKEEKVVPEVEKPKEETFPAKYYFINQGDHNVRHVNLWTTTVYPKLPGVC